MECLVEFVNVRHLRASLSPPPSNSAGQPHIGTNWSPKRGLYETHLMCFFGGYADQYEWKVKQNKHFGSDIHWCYMGESCCRMTFSRHLCNRCQMILMLITVFWSKLRQLTFRSKYHVVYVKVRIKPFIGHLGLYSWKTEADDGWMCLCWTQGLRCSIFIRSQVSEKHYMDHN